MTGVDKFSWLSDGPIDYELKQYRMLATLSRLRTALGNNSVWPVIEEVEAQLDYLYRLKYEIEVKDEQLKVAKDIDFINFEIIYEKENSQKTLENSIMDAIIDDAIVEFGDIYMDERSVWREIEALIQLTWIPVKPNLLTDGYVIIPDGDKFNAYYFEKPTKMSKGWRLLNLKFEKSFKFEPDAVLKFCDSMKVSKDSLMFCRISNNFGKLPHEDAILPVVKSVLFNSLVKDFA